MACKASYFLLLPWGWKNRTVVKCLAGNNLWLMGYVWLGESLHTQVPNKHNKYPLLENIELHWEVSKLFFPLVIFELYSSILYIPWGVFVYYNVYTVPCAYWDSLKKIKVEMQLICQANTQWPDPFRGTSISEPQLWRCVLVKFDICVQRHSSLVSDLLLSGLLCMRRLSTDS